MALTLSGSTGVTGPNEATTVKAWVNFNGQGTIAIRDDGNVSSITDHGTGHYGMNFSNAMTDANFANLALGHEDTTGGVSSTWVANGARYTFVSTAARFGYARGAGDATYFCASVIR